MQNRTEITGLSPMDRLRQMLRKNMEVFRFLGVALMSYLTAGSYILGDIAPFGVAFSASVKPKYGIAATIGAVLGYAFSPLLAVNMKYIGAVILIGVGRWVFSSGKMFRYNVMVAPFLAGVSLCITSMAVTFAAGLYLDTVMLSLSETMLAAGSAYFMARSIQAVSLGLENADRNDIICLIVSFAIGIITLSRIEFFTISLGRVVAILVLLYCAQTLGEGGGTVAGVGAGATAAMLGTNYGFLMAAYSLGGLASGIVSGGGRLAVAAAFVITNGMVSIIAPTQGMMMGTIYEAFIASVIFMLLPASLFSTRHVARLRGATGVQDNLLQHLMFKRLQLVSEGLTDICDTTRQVSEKLDDMAVADISTVYSDVADSVCRRCGHRSRCWQLDYIKTMDALNDAVLHLKKKQVISKSELPDYFTENCSRIEDFVITLNNVYGEYLRKLGTRRKVSQVRSVVTDQFEGMALMIDELSQDIRTITKQDHKSSAKVQEYLKDQGLEPEYACCYLDENDRMTVESVISPFKLARMDKVKAALDISDICERQFAEPSVYTLDKKTLINFTEKANYTVRVGAHQIVEEGSRITGDSFQTMTDRKGGSVAILSDGMGSGGSAAVDSAMTSTLISRLVQANVGFDAALKMVNSALLVKSGEESLATVDITNMDLYTGKATFYKAGAAPTFFVKNGQVGYIESTSLPAGILRGVAFEKSAMSFREGDSVIMVSDGVTSTGIDWMASEISSHRGEDPQALAETIAKTAKGRHLPGRDDDITVVVMKLEKGI